VLSNVCYGNIFLASEHLGEKVVQYIYICHLVSLPQSDDDDTHVENKMKNFYKKTVQSFLS